MRVLVLNPGSSTLKHRLLQRDGSSWRALASGVADRVEGDALARAATDVLRAARRAGIDAVGCRVVHGGARFDRPTLVTPEVVAAVREAGRLAPLHNPSACAVLDAALAELPGVPLVAVFDTAFHSTLPPVAALYALPLEWAEQKGLRRYGFHGTSHRYVSGRLAALSPGARAITCHLGNGASVCAVRDGVSIDTSMGLTPLEGLVMGTRCGDVDAGLVLHLIRREGMSAEAVEHLLERESGLRGLGGDADVRKLLANAAAGDARAALALEAFAYRVKKYVGAYAAALGGLDAIAFTGGIGENAPAVRAAVCRGLEFLGVRLDAARNDAARGEAKVSADGPGVAVWVIPTDEEGQIATETAGALPPEA